MKCQPLFFALAVIATISCAQAQDREVREIASRLGEELASSPQATVAVVDFTDLQGNVTELGRYLAEQVSIALTMTNKGIGVIDRTHLKALVQEYKLNASGLIDPATAQKIGQIAGVKILVSGTLTPFSDSVQLAVKALDAKTARILAASTADIARTRTVEALLGRSIGTTGSTAPAESATAVSAPVSPPRSQSVQTLVSHQFSFSLRSCQQTGDTLTCDLEITNLTSDHRLGLVNTWSRLKTRVIDGSGQEHVAEMVRLGKEYNNVVYNSMIMGVPIAAQIRFTKLSARISTIAVLEIACLFENEAGNVQFRRVAVD